jgi:hypothetical protein
LLEAPIIENIFVTTNYGVTTKSITVTEPKTKLSFEKESKKVEEQMLYLDLMWVDTSLQPLPLPKLPQIQNYQISYIGNKFDNYLLVTLLRIILW